ncbi:MAG: iron-sulfur binding oxidoreductase [Nocardioides sp.]|nr:iron-sulfur binding oxidoreductase [Nocardioides sp.]
MEDRQSASKIVVTGQWPEYAEAHLGFRNYWYPAMASSSLGKRPQAVKLLGEDVVLVRDNGRAYALNDRCPHRGVPLSMGRRQFPGTISCAYHGWTYDLKDGNLVAALTDGPDSPICGKRSVRIAAYPVEERAGLIWVYIGDAPAPPIEEDVPEELLKAGTVPMVMVETRKGNWRYGMENAVDEAHAKYLHRRTPFYFFSKFPVYSTDVRMEVAEDGKWLVRTGKQVFDSQTYGELGSWPGREWWRVGGGVSTFAARLPAIFRISHKTWSDYQFFVPVDEHHHLAVMVSAKWPSRLGKAWWKLYYHAYVRPFHHIMLNRWEDDRMVSMMSIPPEKLFRPDISVTTWRKWSSETARRTPEAPATSKP